MVQGAKTVQVSEGIDFDQLTPEQAAALRASIDRGEAQFLAGEGIAGEEVFAWMRSWGTDNELPVPRRKPRKA